MNFKTYYYLAVFIPMAFILVNCKDAYSYSTVYPTGTTIYQRDFTFDGYTIFAAKSDAAHPRRIVMIDMYGNIVHYWEMEGCDLGMLAKPLPNGNILTYVSYAKDDKALVELDWDSNVVWAFYKVNHRNLHHDFERLANGNTLLLCARLRTVPAVSPLPIHDDYIIEVEGVSNDIVWSWCTSDHFEEFGFSSQAKEMIALRGGDWAHSNSIQSLPPNTHGDPRFKEGNILVSQRETNLIFVIDKGGSEKVVWKVDPDINSIISQHHATMLEQGLNGAGRILLFDNGGSAGYPKVECRLYSRVIEIDPITSYIKQEYNANKSGLHDFTFFSPFSSGVQRLPNGNTLICEGNTGRLFEITPTFEIVWEYVNPFVIHAGGGRTNQIYRATRVEPSWVQFD